MPRPRVHDPDRLLDVAERLVASEGPDAVTIRRLAAESRVSNGAIYHAFGSLPALLGRMWLRAAADFLNVQERLSEDPDPVSAVVAAAGAPAMFADRRAYAARMLVGIRRDDLLGPDVPADLAEAMLAQDERLLALLVRLSRALWGRADGPSVEVVTLCLVDLPTAFFHRALSEPSAGTPAIALDTRRRLEAAVRAVLALPPPPRPTVKGRS
ncbi:TetR/AcrR family transcriptional regulator [Actinomadura rupiterrae]|uniref:TetR/AcrR family transcriptional regulator n=1 Tax=Actinomadura rupiterrae TaxID=559627 RepID=UPI0020A37623|nr:TetR/AcrR family transcriptional regulator [Actinomadura rupiterrae]MCP2341536.1 AcrR family transcriptional regulator [Actinomadura rupiterrae]